MVLCNYLVQMLKKQKRKLRQTGKKRMPDHLSRILLAKKAKVKEVDNAGEGGTDKAGEKADDGFVASDEDQNEQSDDPTFFSQSEIEVLQQLSERREKLEQMQEEIDTREGLMSAAEKRIDRKIADLRQLETTIKGLIKTHDEQQEAEDWQSGKNLRGNEAKRCCPYL